MINPTTVVSAATGRAIFMVKVMSGWLCLIALRMRRKTASKATKINSQQGHQN
jgi:hypothetical protein